MKYLFILMVLSSVIFGYEIEFQKKFSKEISNDEITSYISIYSKHKMQKKAIYGLSKYKTFMEKTKDIKKLNIKQNTYPEYRYEKQTNKRVLEGYKATLTYTISSDSPTKISEYIEELLKIKKYGEAIQVTFSNLTYQVSKKKKEATEDALRLEAIVWGKYHGMDLSVKVGQKCEVHNIIINPNSYIRPMHTTYRTLGKSAMAMESNIDVSMPTPSDTNISINSLFKFQCK